MQKSFLLLLLLVVGEECQSKLKVTILYETLCPDCINFIENQLYHTWKDVGTYFNLQMVPYGRASARKINGTWRFTCQHGSKECYGNKIQSCVLSNNSIDKSIEFIYCAEHGNPSKNSNLIECCRKTGVLWKNVKDCLKSGKGDELLAANGKITEKYIGEIKMVPSIILNERYDQAVQDEAIVNFKDVVCKHLANAPDACYNAVLKWI